MDEEQVIVPSDRYRTYRWLGLTIGVLLTLAVFVLPLAILTLYAPPEVRGGLIIISYLFATMVIAVAMADALYIPAHIRSMRYRFEAERLVAEQGVFFRIRAVIPYARVTDIRMIQGPIERRFGIHRVAVQTAGTSGTEALLLGIANADAIREGLLARRQKALGDATGAVEEAEILTELKAIRRDVAAIREQIDRRK